MTSTDRTTGRISRVTSETRLEDDAGTGDGLDIGPGAADPVVDRDPPAAGGRRGGPAAGEPDVEVDGFEDGDVDDDRPGGARLSIPLVPVLAVLLVLLLGGAAYLWFTRPSTSSVTTADYVEVLEAARSEVVDLTSFDYQTLDDDIAQARKITVGDLQKESVAQLTDNRKQLTAQQAVVNTQVVGAGVTRADGSNGTVLLVIQSTQRTKAAAQPSIVRYRIQADLTKVDGRWLLSGITGR
jgi:Mce-associated membrane protein